MTALPRERTPALLEQLRAFWLTVWGAPLLAGAISAGLFLLALQTHISGSLHPYTTDVGELQNALPRWGTIHFTGYPQYSITGSAIVTVLRLVSVQPAAGASLVSLLWGTLTAVTVVYLARELGAGRLVALLGALLFSVSTSMWIDSAMAEVHSMSMFLTAGMLLFAFRFERTGSRADWLGLVGFASHGVIHGRALIGLLPAVALIAVIRWREALRDIWPAVAVAATGPITYLYLPLREWMGASWTFGETDTWSGFWAMVLNQKNARDAEILLEPAALAERVSITLQTLNDDLPLLLIVIGLLGLWFVVREHRWRDSAALTLAWIPYAAVPVIIYAGFVGDAILAVKLPVSMLAGVGLALIVTRFAEWNQTVGRAASVVLVLVLAAVGWRNYPDVVAITRDRTIEEVVAVAQQAANPTEPTVLSIIWSRSYWAAAYAQSYRGELEGVEVVDHNADFARYAAEGTRILTLTDTLYLLPVEWWQDRLAAPVYLEAFAPGILEVRTEPRFTSADPQYTVNEVLGLQSAQVSHDGDGRYTLTVDWQALAVPDLPYSVAVHLVAADPPTGPQDLISQADSPHLAQGWYPTTLMEPGQLVRGVYRLDAPEGSPSPVGVRVTAYYIDEDGQFVNGTWITLPVQ